jgi:WD domain, G-beta repeat
VLSVALSRDGARALSGSDDQTVKLWDTATGQLVHTLEGRAGLPLSVQFLSDGTRALSAGLDDAISWVPTLRLWDAGTGKLIRSTRLEGVADMTPSPDGLRMAVSGRGHTFELLDTLTGEVIRTFEGHADVVKGVAFSSDGALALSASKDTIGPGKLTAWLAKVPAQKSLIVLDACESGASEAFRSGDRAHETVMAQLEHATGRNTIAAAPAGKAAYEGYNGHGVLTYAILEALNRPDGAPAQPVSVFGIAQHISLQVPAITQRTFGTRQQPRFIPTGDDFSLGLRQAVLKDLPVLMTPTAPTHINPKVIRVFKDSGGKGGVTVQLQPFTPVAVVSSARGWAQVARDGKILGHVQERGLRKLAQ